MAYFQSFAIINGDEIYDIMHIFCLWAAASLEYSWRGAVAIQRGNVNVILKATINLPHIELVPFLYFPMQARPCLLCFTALPTMLAHFNFC